VDLVRAPHPPALVDRATWDAAQKVSAARGNVQDAEQPRTRPGRRYRYRGRLWCKICKRRMRGVTRTSPTTKIPIQYTYYQCPHDPGHRAHTTAYPEHPNVMISEKALMTATASFFTQYVFGPDRAAMLTAQLPADAAAETARRAAAAKRLDQQLAKTETAQAALITELETPADPGDPAAQALRERIRTRYRELHDQQKTLEAQRDQLDIATTEVSDPALLDALPILGDILTQAPAGMTEQLFEAFRLQAVYSKQHHQVTIRVTITDATPDAVTQLLAAPRCTPTGEATTISNNSSHQQECSHSAHHLRVWVKLPLPP
jgi:site-specific DNA recombinase